MELKADLNQIAWGLVHPSLEKLKKWRFHNLPGQLGFTVEDE